MSDNTKNDLEQAYEIWSRYKEPIWPLLKYRIRMAAFGAVFGAVLAILIAAVIAFTMPSRVTDEIWIGMGIMTLGGAFSALIQNWRR